MNELNKKLLDSFSWTINNGQPPNCKYVEIIQSNGKTSTDWVSRYNWDRWGTGSDIIKYREINAKDYLFADNYSDPGASNNSEGVF